MGSVCLSAFYFVLLLYFILGRFWLALALHFSQNSIKRVLLLDFLFNAVFFVSVPVWAGIGTRWCAGEAAVVCHSAFYLTLLFYFIAQKLWMAAMFQISQGDRTKVMVADGVFALLLLSSIPFALGVLMRMC